MIVAILAAGKSTRFQGCKLLADLWGQSIIEHVLENTEGFGEQIMITGAFHDEIKEKLDGSGTQLLFNKDFEKGKLTSVKLALNFAKDKKQDLLLTLGDLPFVEPHDYLSLIESSIDQAVFSSFDGEVGPPVFLPYQTLKEIDVAGLSGRLKETFTHYDMVYLETAAMDIDFQSDLERFTNIHHFISIQNSKNLRRNL